MRAGFASTSSPFPPSPQSRLRAISRIGCEARTIPFPSPSLRRRRGALARAGRRGSTVEPAGLTGRTCNHGHPSRMVGEAATLGLGPLLPPRMWLLSPGGHRTRTYPGTAILPHEGQVGLKPAPLRGSDWVGSIGAAGGAGTTSPPRFAGMVSAAFAASPSPRRAAGVIRGHMRTLITRPRIAHRASGVTSELAALSAPAPGTAVRPSRGRPRAPDDACGASGAPQSYRGLGKASPEFSLGERCQDLVQWQPASLRRHSCYAQHF